MPILFWTDDDIAEFVNESGVKCHGIYYRRGYFDATQRLGCIGCPLQSRKKRLRQFKENPKFVRLYVRNAQVWFDAHTDNGKSYKYGNAINAFVATLFFETYQDFYEHTYTLFGKTDWRKYLEDYFKIDLSDVEYL